MDLNSLSKKNFLGALGGGGQKDMMAPFLGFGLPPPRIRRPCHELWGLYALGQVL